MQRKGVSNLGAGGQGVGAQTEAEAARAVRPAAPAGATDRRLLAALRRELQLLQSQNERLKGRVKAAAEAKKRMRRAAQREESRAIKAQKAAAKKAAAAQKAAAARVLGGC